MKGRPKKYRTGKRILIFVDEDTLAEYDLLVTNRSDGINKLIKAYIKSQPAKSVKEL